MAKEAKVEENPNEANTDLVTVNEGGKLKHVTRAEYDKDPDKFKRAKEQDGSVVISTHPGGQKNPSGTYSMPTPTDIRFPNKLETEFENNLGAFIGKSAAGLRAQMGLPNMPGGIRPLQAADVKPIEGKEGEYGIYYGEQLAVTGLTVDDQKAFKELKDGEDDQKKADLIAKKQAAMQAKQIPGQPPEETPLPTTPPGQHPAQQPAAAKRVPLQQPS